MSFVLGQLVESRIIAFPGQAALSRSFLELLFILASITCPFHLLFLQVTFFLNSFLASSNVSMIYFHLNVFLRPFIPVKSLEGLVIILGLLSLEKKNQGSKWALRLRTGLWFVYLKTEEYAKVYFCQEWVPDMGLMNFELKYQPFKRKAMFNYIKLKLLS